MKLGLGQWTLVLASSSAVALVCSALVTIMMGSNELSDAPTTRDLQHRFVDALSKLDKRISKLEARSRSAGFPEQTDGTRLSDQAAALDDLRLALAALSKRLDRLEQSMTDKPSIRTEGQVTSYADQREQAALTMKKRVDELENRLSRESVDSSLGSTVNHLINQVVAKKPEWSRNSQVATRCANTLCRVEIDFEAGMEPLDRFELENTLIQTIGSELPEGAALRYINGTDGSQSLVGYFSRTSPD